MNNHTFSETYAQQTDSESLELTDGVVSQATHALLRGVGTRHIEGEHTRYSYDMSPQAWTDAMKRHAKAMPSESGLADSRAAEPLDAQFLHSLETEVRNLDPRVVTVKAATSRTTDHIFISNNEGLCVRDVHSRLLVMLRVVLEQDGRHEMGFASVSLPDSNTTGIVCSLCQRAIAQADHLFRAITPEGGDMPVVMAAGASGILLHEAIGHAFEADFIRQRTSIFTDRLGQRICNPSITIVDDGTLAGAQGSFLFDDEGTPAQCTHLVHEGRLESFLYDRITARHFGVSPTGNGRRQSFRNTPVPRMTNTYLLPGEASEEDIIRSVKHGIYAKDFTNGQVQIGAGDFTFFLKTGFLIEDGHLTRPIRDVNIIGNGPRALADISLVGNNLTMDRSAAFCGKAGQQVPVGQGLPTVLVDHLTVGGV